jgi:hypothetical protein
MTTRWLGAALGWGLVAVVTVVTRPVAADAGAGHAIRGVQKPAAPAGTTETAHLTLTTSVAHAAGRLSLVVDVTPKANIHVYAPQQKEYIPISVAVDPLDGLTVSPARFPKAEKILFTPLNETQLVYTKPFKIVQDVAVGSMLRAPGGSITVKGTVRYQACDDAICYLPVKVPVTWTVPVPRAR